MDEGKNKSKIAVEIGDLSDEIKKSLAEMQQSGSKSAEELSKKFDELITAMSKRKPVDLTPVINVVSDISKQNKSTLDLLGRLLHSKDNDEIIKQLTESISKSNKLIEEGFKYKTDYTTVLKTISERPLIQEIQVTRDEDGRIKKGVVVYQKNKA